MIRIGTSRSSKFGRRSRMVNVSFQVPVAGTCKACRLAARDGSIEALCTSSCIRFRINPRRCHERLGFGLFGRSTTLLNPVRQAMGTRSAALEACARFIDGGSPAQYQKYTRSL